MFHKQDTTSSVPTLYRERIQANLLAELDKEKLVEINGIDPGIHSTATMSSVTAGCLFDSINRFSILLTDEDETPGFKSTNPSVLNLTPAFVNNVTFSNVQRRKREKKIKMNKEVTYNQLAQDRLARKIRLKDANNKIISHYRHRKSSYFRFFW